jgi:hypothetical protein
MRAWNHLLIVSLWRADLVLASVPFICELSDRSGSVLRRWHPPKRRERHGTSVQKARSCQCTDWRGKYMIEGDPSERWRDCRIIDVSSAGAGLELVDTSPHETEGRQLILAVHLRAAVRSAGPSRGQILRVGTQFVDLSADELSYLASLAEVDARW